MTLRADLAIISQWIKPGSRILDLGCGNGTLLNYLHKHANVSGYGLEIDEEDIVKCIIAGVNVIQSDLDQGISDYFDADSFDYVVMTQTLQAIRHPDRLLEDMMRVGSEGIVTFPNMGHWKGRLQLFLAGHMPLTRSLPNRWYNTPNIHLCTLTDFENLCREKSIHVIKRTVVDYTHQRGSLLMKLFPNLFGEIAIYHFRRK